MKRILYFIFLATAIQATAQDHPAYLLYNQDGKQIKYAKMMKGLEEADLIFFGELHTDPISHWLQIEITQELFSLHGGSLVLGAEMFEADNQLLLDEYLSGAYNTDKFEAEAKLWGNYETDYKALVEFAKENELDFIATNIPRRYASMVHYKGPESLLTLPDEARNYMAPLPMSYDPDVPCYKNMLGMMGMHSAPAVRDSAAQKAPAVRDSTAQVAPAVRKPPAMHSMKKQGPPMANLPMAQNAKDATMAHFIMENWSKGKVFFHFNGEYHSRNFEGIIWHIRQQNPEVNIMSISVVQQEDISSLEEDNSGIASYVVCVPDNMTRTKR